MPKLKVSNMVIFKHFQALYLIDSSDDSSHSGVSWPINSTAIIGRTPRGRVNVNQIRLVTHRVGFNQVSHVGLVQHANTRYHGIVRHARAAYPIIARARYLTGAPGAVAVKPVIGVAGVGIGVIGAEVVASARVVVMDQIGMHVIYTVIHDGGGDIFAGNSLCPGGGGVEI